MKKGADHAGSSSVCLVVDDEPAILRLISVVLEDLGCETLAAPNAEAALELLQEMTPNLVIADVKMPGVGGAELVRVMKGNKQLAATPLLLMSAYGEPHGHSGDGFIAKPFDIETLTDFVTPYIQRKAL